MRSERKVYGGWALYMLIKLINLNKEPNRRIYSNEVYCRPYVYYNKRQHWISGILNARTIKIFHS